MNNVLRRSCRGMRTWKGGGKESADLKMVSESTPKQSLGVSAAP